MNGIQIKQVLGMYLAGENESVVRIGMLGRIRCKEGEKLLMGYWKKGEGWKGGEEHWVMVKDVRSVEWPGEVVKEIERWKEGGVVVGEGRGRGIRGRGRGVRGRGRGGRGRGRGRGVGRGGAVVEGDEERRRRVREEEARKRKEERRKKEEEERREKKGSFGGFFSSWFGGSSK
eukprot:TRINITY_DN2802_c0_g1_i1.p2 TRINITY_DN2802_c0_g1~~TRINITY_DN2802_c0_g1_i1.p2  ORF type:complete len:174 (+),score=105.13 TRINITY_DN2802_c0_g1_i1:533-1054(+)